MLLFLLVVALAIGAVGFVLQNSAPVVVTLGLWQFEIPLAMLVLLALAAGASVASLVSTPSVLRRQWSNMRLKREMSALKNEYDRQAEQLRRETESARPAPEREYPSTRRYLGLKEMIAGFSRRTRFHP